LHLLFDHRLFLVGMSTTTPAASDLPALGSQATLMMVVPLLMFFAIYCVLNFLHFWSRREFEPIRSRRPLIVLFYMASIATHTIARNINREIGFSDAVPCGASMSIPLTLLALQNLMFILRAVILYVDLFVNKYSIMLYGSLKLKQTQLLEGPEKEIPWLLKYRKYLTTEYFSLCILVLLFFQMFIVVIPLNGSPAIATASRNSPLCMSVQVYVGYAAFFVSMFEILVFAVILINLQRTTENFGIKKELVLSAIAFTVSAVLQGANAILNLQPEEMFARTLKFRGYQLFDVLFPMWFVLYRAIQLPTLMTYEWEEMSGKLRDFTKLDQENKLKIKDLTSLLNHPDGFVLFQNFLKKELAVEFALFWKDVERYKRGEVTASEIFSLYISENAPLFVNIPSEMRTDIIWQFNKDVKVDSDRSRIKSVQKALLQFPSMTEMSEVTVPKVDIFKAAQAEVLRVMFSDAFVRFRKTPEYTRFARTLAVETPAKLDGTDNSLGDKMKFRTIDSVSTEFKTPKVLQTLDSGSSMLLYEDL
jgi:hypothetical protein